MTTEELKKLRSDYVSSVSTGTALILERLHRDISYHLPIHQLSIDLIEDELLGWGYRYEDDDYPETWKDIGREIKP